MKLAILNPLPDFGINQYSHELSESLGQSGAEVALYNSSVNGLPACRYYQRYPVLNAPLFRQSVISVSHSGRSESPLENWASQALSTQPVGNPKPEPPRAPYSPVKRWFLTMELVLHLRRQNYQAIWTQWPDLECYQPAFWRICRAAGLPLIHTVHNVVPHEGTVSTAIPAAYRDSDVLVVHSNFARSEMIQRYPSLAGKILVAPHGTYTIYPRRPEARDRIRHQLNIPAGQRLVLFCGAIRPYKNLDAVLEALPGNACRNAVLVVAGEEAHFPDLVSGDALGRARRMARHLGIEDRVRFIPRFLDSAELSELLEAGDIVALPYLHGYGSGQLLLAMTFGKYVVSSQAGGAGEYLKHYPASTLLTGTDPTAVSLGLAEAIQRVSNGLPPSKPAPELQWTEIARQLVSGIQQRLRL